MLRAVVLSAGVFTVISALSPAFAAGQNSHAAEKAAVAHMHWLKGTQKLGESHGTFAVPSGGAIVAGADAHKLDEILNGSSESDVEAVAFLKDRTLYLSYSDSGYVTADDWSKVDPKALLKGISDATDSGNAEREKNGMSAMHVDGWVQAPTFDRNRKSVRWVMGAHDGQNKFVNAVALQLGRQGFERFTLVSDGTQPQQDAAVLASTVRDYTFNQGFKFTDYVQGDKLAGYGLAALVGTAAGATIAKTVGFGAILLLFKKFIILIIAGVVSVFSFIKRAITGNRMQVGPPKIPPAASP